MMLAANKLKNGNPALQEKQLPVSLHGMCENHIELDCRYRKKDNTARRTR